MESENMKEPQLVMGQKETYDYHYENFSQKDYFDYYDYYEEEEEYFYEYYYKDIQVNILIIKINIVLMREFMSTIVIIFNTQQYTLISESALQ